MTDLAERFRTAYEAFVGRGDLTPFAEMLDPRVEWRAWNDEGNCHNRDEAMTFVRAAIEQGALIEMPEFVGSGPKFVMIPHLDELPSFFPPDAEGLFQVVETQGDKVIRIQDFVHKDQAFAAAGVA
jgi:hypothetical protein